MKPIRTILVHPVSLAIGAIALGLLIHQLTRPRGDSGGGETRVSANPPPTAGPRSLVSGTAEEIDAPPESSQNSANSRDGRLDGGAAEIRSLTAPPSPSELYPVTFREVWAYLYVGEEDHWRSDTAVTDVGLFCYKLDEAGHPRGDWSRSSLDLVRTRGARAHLVVASAGQKTLLHFLLDPAYGARPRLLAEIVELAQLHPVDGLQIDFESLRLQDRKHLASFLEELRALLPPRMIFSLALPARHKVELSDPFVYWKYAPLADRFVIMVYDEHWGGGAPGSVSSRAWHDRVVRLALMELPPDKVVVGLPLYGRLWGGIPDVPRATRYSEMSEILKTPGIDIVYDVDTTHHYRFEVTVTAEGWFDDAASLHAKFSSARRLGAVNVGFWRLGQEDPNLWSLIQVDTRTER